MDIVHLGPVSMVGLALDMGAVQRLTGLGGRLARSLFRSNRRIRLDALLSEHVSVYGGRVLDVGSRPRGRFTRPTRGIERWIVADIAEELVPDLVTDVAALGLRSGTVQAIKATELFEHVSNPEAGLSECRRVLVDGGIMVMSVPFLFRIHGDPFDFQRWTQAKWRRVFDSLGFEILVERVTGTFFTVLGDMLKALLGSLPKIAALPVMTVSYPVLGLLARLDDTRVVTCSGLLSSFHGGYFYVVRKSPADCSSASAR